MKRRVNVSTDICVMQTLTDGDAVQKLMSLLLAFGNYMNSGIYVINSHNSDVVLRHFSSILLHDTFLLMMPVFVVMPA